MCVHSLGLLWARRSKRLIIALVLTVATLITLARLKKGPIPTKPESAIFDITERRKAFRNPVYRAWNDKLFDDTPEAHCSRYFHALGNPKSHYKVDISALHSFRYDKHVYKKKKWVRERMRTLRKDQSSKAKMSSEDQHRLIEEEFSEASLLLSQFEEKMTADFAHLRIYGKCFLQDSEPLPSDLCSLEKGLFPWLSQEYPLFESWDGLALKRGHLPHDRAPLRESCFLQGFQKRCKGQGIVIPLLPGLDSKRQSKNAANLIRVLRGLGNKVPIQVTFNNMLSEEERTLLVGAARNEMKVNQDHPFSSKSFPKQDLWFVDLSSVRNTKRHPFIALEAIYNSPTFINVLSTIFNSFEDALVMLPQAIPLLDDPAARLFGSATYKEHGHLFFKHPSWLNQPRVFKPGYHEVANLLKHHIMPSAEDYTHFGLFGRTKGSLVITDRVWDRNFQNLMDGSMFVVNKGKALSGLMISCNLQLYSILSSRFDILPHQTNAEVIWIGQEMAGTTKRVNFNYHYGVSIGVLTPPENVPSHVASLAREVCSSSWGQLDQKDDFSLVYVTTHQLENWDIGAFRTEIETKYTVIREKVTQNMFEPTKENATVMVKDADTALFEKIQRNPLSIEVVLNPPVLKLPVYMKAATEPPEAWMANKGFANREDMGYMCAYDLVGGSELQERGILEKYGEAKRGRYDYVVELWRGGVMTE